MPVSPRSTEQIRRLVASDAVSLHELDRLGNPSPWSVAQYRQSLESGDFGLAIDAESQLLAYALFNRVLDEVTLLNIGVRPEARRRGYARRLLHEGFAELQVEGVTRCLLEVRESNTAAIALYRALGFRIDGVRRGYYPLAQGREDGLLMSVTLAQSAP